MQRHLRVYDTILIRAEKTNEHRFTPGCERKQASGLLYLDRTNVVAIIQPSSRNRGIIDLEAYLVMTWLFQIP